MNTNTIEHPESVEPTEGDSLLARESSQRLARLIGGLEERQYKAAQTDNWTNIEIRLDGETEIVALPTSALHLLNQILAQMAEGNGISILPQKCELTTVQAAEVLNVSRPYLIGLLEKGEIPYRKVGTHRRILLKDMMNYKQDVREKRKATLRELSEMSEDLGFDD